MCLYYAIKDIEISVIYVNKNQFFHFFLINTIIKNIHT